MPLVKTLAKMLVETLVEGLVKMLVETLVEGLALLMASMQVIQSSNNRLESSR